MAFVVATMPMNGLAAHSLSVTQSLRLTLCSGLNRIRNREMVVLRISLDVQTQQIMLKSHPMNGSIISSIKFDSAEINSENIQSDLLTSPFPSF